MIVSFETRIAVRRGTQAVEHLLGRAAEEVRVAQASSPAANVARVDPEGVLEVRADVGVGVVDARSSPPRRAPRDPLREPVAARRPPGGAVATTSAPSGQLGVDRACWS